MPVIHINLGKAQISNDPSTLYQTHVDLAMHLSEKYGRMVRQGQSFKITGIQPRMSPTTAGYDVGVAVSGSMGFVPVTKHSRQAWNEAFQLWRKQKGLKSTVGSVVNADDMEFAWDADSTSARTSYVYAQGMGDNVGASMVLNGSSVENPTNPLAGEYFSLEDFHKSNHPVTPPSVQHWSGATHKEKKYDKFYPDPEYVYWSSTLSSVFANNDVGFDVSADSLSGSVSHSDIYEFPEPVNALCGLLEFNWYCIPDDTASQDEGDDEAQIHLAIYIKSWKPLVYSPRKSRRSRRKSYNRRYARRSYGGRSARRYRRGRRKYR